MLDVEVMGNKKRKRCGRVFRFKNFGEPGYPVEFTGPFRDNVNALLEFANSESKYLGFGRMPIWSFQLEVHRHPPSHIFLFVIEEATEASSMNRHCKHCQYVGWGNHFICNKKYHFVLPSKETLATSLSCEEVPCEAIAEAGAMMSNNNNGKSKLIELQGHMMQAVFHSNGFGHLLCVNGLETGSDLAGHQIMDFWDRLCTGLQARKVSLNDVSQKKGMELKLINGIAYGEPWFGRWGYKFGRGCFGVTQSTYEKAIEAIRSIPLYLLIHQIGNSSYHDIPIILSRYQTLSDQTLVTLADLFHFMLELKSQLPRRENYPDSHNTGFSLEANCRWSPKRIEMATRVIVEALKRAEFRWISRQEVRDAARAYIGDTGLLDFVLKSLGNHVVGNYMVRRSLNPVTKVLEYCLEDISNIVFPSHLHYHHQDHGGNNNNLVMVNNTNKSIKDKKYKISRAQVMKDMFYLYKYILKDPKQTQGSIFSAIPLAARIILDTKYLIKEYFGELPFQADLGLDGKLSLHCTITLRNYDNNDPNKVLMAPPYECITLKSSATINDLKLEVERNFREIYYGLRSFCVDSIKNLENCGGNDMVFGTVEVGGKLVVEGWIDINIGDNISNIIGEICEGNYDNNNGKVVDCSCGTKEDDGERMVCCDICENWQHTRCVRIPNDEQVPSIFLCRRCEQEIVMCPSLP
ncbi:PHD finger protein MALE STERILITY 1 [Prosopis cineraria]|uniref:PHD finger protein MALE STERILITY 1 n=1 Tax=Prosopis cineraria TaxID=364024 RepID=UPI0024101D65|nr:PHD finger protein MALE STERILITY 1 [Prosopis cineraria]